MSYFISQPSDRGWRISPELLLPKLRQHWPDVAVKDVRDPERRYSYEWVISSGDGHLEGMLSKKETAVVLEGSPDAVAEFATWFEAEFSPPDRSLILYDESFERVIPLSGHTPAAVIAATFR